MANIATDLNVSPLESSWKFLLVHLASSPVDFTKTNEINSEDSKTFSATSRHFSMDKFDLATECAELCPKQAQKVCVNLQPCEENCELCKNEEAANAFAFSMDENGNYVPRETCSIKTELSEYGDSNYVDENRNYVGLLLKNEPEFIENVKLELSGMICKEKKPDIGISSNDLCKDVSRSLRRDSLLRNYDKLCSIKCKANCPKIVETKGTIIKMRRLADFIEEFKQISKNSPAVAAAVHEFARSYKQLKLRINKFSKKLHRRTKRLQRSNDFQLSKQC